MSASFHVPEGSFLNDFRAHGNGWGLFKKLPAKSHNEKLRARQLWLLLCACFVASKAFVCPAHYAMFLYNFL
jgi:hypothetical protein